MIDPPRTRTEAEHKRYGKWAGMPEGIAYDPMHCAYTVHFYNVAGRQCSRKALCGPDHLYCAQHAGIVERTSSLLFDVVAVSIRNPSKKRLIASYEHRENAEAIIKMAVMRHGVQDELFQMIPSSDPE